ncbi:MAG TPA: 1,6-anhydro-N-acetylmuramyl-L-alanine amidase AmpD [Cycloclasticus sp.]|jgi:AmpD protein|nr:1,6-anhydro-N-acetylmuramyl-L-alanine amidase AmpD [Cycloclasticus sp.]HIL92898.1 1,6-anhydro-N-acetylmuramyl-L-alanine amidase AmpD [Cycloclasticus sp.]
MNRPLQNIQNGLLNDVRFIESPNKNARPKPNNIRLIIVHGISLPPDEFGGCWIDDFFLNRLDPNAHPYFEDIYQLEVSSHLLIRRDGGITQYVPFEQRAWHAGLSCYEDEENCNDFSIGIELEGADHIPYTDEQYAVLSNCCRLLIQHYPLLTQNCIVGHCDVAPGRKTDPGDSFDWERFRQLLSCR